MSSSKLESTIRQANSDLETLQRARRVAANRDDLAAVADVLREISRVEQIKRDAERAMAALRR